MLWENDLTKMVEGVEDEHIRTYLSWYVLPNIDYFKTAGRRCKETYLRWSVVSLLISAIIPVVSVFSDGGIVMKATLAALGSAVTFISGYLLLYDSRNAANAYSKAREELLRIVLQYFTKTGEFVQCADQRACDVLLVDRCEMIMEMKSETVKKENDQSNTDNT